MFVVARMAGREIPWWVISCGVLLPIVLVWPCVFSGQTPLPVDQALSFPPWNSAAKAAPYNENFNDAVTQIAPWQKAVRQAWKEGSLPFWNRWNGCGTPLAAAGLPEAFSPFTFLMFPLPLARAFTLLVLTKLLLAFCGMWLWLAEMRVSAMSAAVGAISFAFSLAMTGWLLFPQSSLLCLWPWALFAFEVLRDSARRRRGVALLAGVLACWGLSHPEMAALGGLFLILWAILREIADPPALRRTVLLAAVVAGVLALGLTAFLWIPEAYAIAASSRLRNAQELWRRLPFRLAPHGPLWKGYITLLFPASFGDGISLKRLLDWSPASFLETSLGYFGLVGWAAVCSFARPGAKRRPEEWILLALAICGAGIALGCWPFFELFLHLPLLRLTPPLRYLAWVSLAGSALAAFELDRLLEDLRRSRRHIVSLLAVFVMLGLGAVAVFQSLGPAYSAAGQLAGQRQILLRTCGVAALAVLLAAAAVIAGKVRLLVPFLGAVACVELVTLGQRLYRFGSPADLFPRTPLLEFLARQPQPFRVLGDGAALFPSTNVFAGLQEIRTHDAVERDDYVSLLARTAGYDLRDYFKVIRDPNSPQLDRLNVKYLVSPPDRDVPSKKWRLVYSGADGRVFENGQVRPRIFASDGLEVRNYRELTNSVTFTSHVRGGAPVLAETSIVTDGGWRARLVPGGPVSAGKTGGPFLSLTLPPGDHEVHLDYRPPGFAPGASLSAATLAALALTGCAIRLRTARASRLLSTRPRS